jgi:ribose transport system permease protein
MNISNIVLQSCMLIIVSLGMTIVMLSNGIDLSAGSIMSLSGVGTGLSLAAGVGLVPSILAGLAVGAACGAVNGFMISKVGLPPFIATFGMLGVADGLSLFFSGGETVYWQEPAFKLIANGQVALVPFPVLIVAAVFLILYFILYTTPFGVNVFAIGGNEEALRLSGVNIVLNKIGIYILSGLTASISGQVLASRISSAHPTAGFGYEFEAIAAAIIGGTAFFGGKGGIAGTVIGALIIAMIRNGLSLLGFTTPVQYCFMGIVLTLGVTLNILIYRKKQ